MELREWTITYVKHKDLAARKLLGHEDLAPEHILFSFKDRKEHWYVLDDLMVPKDLKEEKTAIVALNSGRNIDFLTRHFSDFAKHKHLTLIFVHTGSGEKWILHPHTHAQVGEPESLSLGLKAMAEAVPMV